MLNTVLFDLDDTLYDEVDYCRSGFKAVAHFLDDTLGRGQSTALFETLWRVFESGNRTTTFNEALAALELEADASLIRSLIRVYRNHKPNLRLPRDSRRILRELRSTYRLGLLTDGYLPAQKLKVRALKLQDCFEHILYTEHLGRAAWKPSPLGFERLLAEMNIPPHQAVYVGDNAAKDFLAPNRLGMVSVQIHRPLGLHTAPPEHDRGAARYRLTGLDDLPGLLQSLDAPAPVEAVKSPV